MIDRTYELREPLITVENVSLSLGEGADRKLILRDLDLHVQNIVRPGMKQGQVEGLLGPSGIGKTQFFNILAGALRPDSGEVKIGIDQVAPQPGTVGVVTQFSQVFYHRRVLDNLILAGTQGGLTRAQAREKALYYLNRFGIEACKDLWPRQLSGGQRQRLAILQQIMVGHQLILMDEPFSSLDVNSVETLAGLITELTQANELLTVVVVTHDIGAAISVSDKLWLMGRERDSSGAFIEGACIVGTQDLIKAGLAWDPDIRQRPEFLQLEAQVAAMFKEIIPHS